MISFQYVAMNAIMSTIIVSFVYITINASTRDVIGWNSGEN